MRIKCNWEYKLLVHVRHLVTVTFTCLKTSILIKWKDWNVSWSPTPSVMFPQCSNWGRDGVRLDVCMGVRVFPQVSTYTCCSCSPSPIPHLPASPCVFLLPSGVQGGPPPGFLEKPREGSGWVSLRFLRFLRLIQKYVCLFSEVLCFFTC